MQSAKAFAPGNISCIFVIRKTRNPAKSGSLGLGFTVNKGVFATAKYNKKTPIIKKNNIKKTIKNQKNIIYFNSKKINFPTVNSVIEKLTNEKIIVKIKSELPLGCGFGISGAAALATAYSLNKLLKLNKSKKHLAMTAHIAEVENSTGLGDVVNQYYGGLSVKYEPSCKFKIKKLPIKNKKIYYKHYSSIDTKKIISNKKTKNKINNSGLNSLRKIKRLGKKDLNLEKLIKISKQFSVNSGLLKHRKVIETIKKIENKNGNASMIMLGNAVFSNKYFKDAKELIIKDKGACLC
jgi:pantoate kinase